MYGKRVWLHSEATLPHLDSNCFTRSCMIYLKAMKEEGRGNMPPGLPLHIFCSNVINDLISHFYIS